MSGDSLKMAVFGAGYVGIATAVGRAEQGCYTMLVELDPDRLEALADGRISLFHEPGLRVAYTSRHAARRIAPRSEILGDGLDLIVVCVGTPIDDTGYADVSHVVHALEQLIPAITAEAACV
jgi:UDP-glucose 6-dehydrogenase